MPGTIHPGDVIGQKYRVDRVIGQGGMGVVVAAHHVQLDEQVAIKVLLPETLGNPEAIARFVQEARATVKIRSEHAVRVQDVGELDDGAPYIVMEYLEGTDLATRFAMGPIPVEEVIDYVLQACEALAEAHKGGIVHRDLKPANLFVTRRADGSPLVKVLDFGISKATGREVALTRTAVFMGSPQYAPPEQMLSAKSADARSDIWALGVILYEAFAGQVPFSGESVMEVASRVMQLTPTDLAALRADLPAGLAAAVMKCLEKKPESRHADIGALARALGPFSPRSALSVQRVSKVMGDGSSVDGLAATVEARISAEGSLPSPAMAAHPPSAGAGSVGTAPGHAVSVGPPDEKEGKRQGKKRAAWAGGLAIALAAVASLAVGVVAVVSRREASPSLTQAHASTPPAASPDVEPSRVAAPSASATSSAPATASAVVEPAPNPIVKRPPPPTPPASARIALPPSEPPGESATPKHNPLHVEAK